MAENSLSSTMQTREKPQGITIRDAEEMGEESGDVLPSGTLVGWRLGAVTVSLALGMFLVGVDASVIGIAIPRITESFGSLNDIAWYGSAYMLPCTVLQPSFGWFYKIFNVTYVYLVSVVLFEGMFMIVSCAYFNLTTFSRLYNLCCRTNF
jgi:MFS family permease